MENNIFLSADIKKKWIKDLKIFDIIYVHAMNGYGKTSQVEALVRENLIKTEEKAVIIEDIQEIRDGVEREQLLSELSNREDGKKVIIISSSEILPYLLPFKLSKRLTVWGKDILRVLPEEIVAMLQHDERFEGLNEIETKKHANKCFEFSFGYAFGVIAYLDRLAERMCDVEYAKKFAEIDLENYFEFEIKKRALPEEIQYLAVYESFHKEDINGILSEERVEKVFNQLCAYGYLEQTHPEKYTFEPNFYRFLWNQLTRKIGEREYKLIEKAGESLEQSCDYKGALRCFSTIRNYEKVIELLIYLSENADGCEFAAICDRYIKEVPEELYKSNPRLIGAKALIAAYSLKRSEYEQLLQSLKGLVEKNADNIGEVAKRVYVRTIIASPIGTADKLKDNLFFFIDYIRKNGIRFDHIMPTGNMPSVINGGIDLLPWSNENKLAQLAIKKAAEVIIGDEFIGVYDVVIGELYYERNQSSKALKLLTQGLNTAKREECIRAQYAAVGVLARMFLSENLQEKAVEALDNMYQKAKSEKRQELLPNIDANKVAIALLRGDSRTYNRWSRKWAPNEFDNFYITLRLELLTKAKVYIAQEKYLSALYVLDVLEEYATTCARQYIMIQINILKAIIYSRRGEAWREYLRKAVKTASKYGFIRVLSDEGNPFLQLFNLIQWEKEEISKAFIESVLKESRKMARYYPNYLKESKKPKELTPKELEVLNYIAKGYKNAEIARSMNVNLGTVKFHISNIMRKYDVGSRVLLVKKARDEGVI